MPVASSAGCTRVGIAGAWLTAVPLTATLRVVAPALVWVMLPVDVPRVERKKRT